MRTIILWLLFHINAGNDLIMSDELNNVYMAIQKRIAKQNKRVKKMRNFLINWISEPSTIRGLVWLAGAFGLSHLTTGQTEAIQYVVGTMAMAGAAGSIPDNFKSIVLARLPKPPTLPK